jgi:pimeloyl-ACP methyl ester carboxylesterase
MLPHKVGYRVSPPCIGAALALLTAIPVPSAAPTQDRPAALRKAIVRGGVQLHYLERGRGVPVVFVHGSLSDYSYWADQVNVFARRYRAITYSRRHNPPNKNKIRPGYSATVDADDLAALIKKLDLGKVHVVGHSYGAFTALFLAVKYPDLVRTLVLAEPPAVSLLAHLPGDRAEIGKKTFADIQKRLVKPVKTAFVKGDRDAGLRAFLAYVLDDPRAWDKLSASARKEALAGAGEWDAMLPTGELFPTLDPMAVRKIAAPVLLLSGEKSYPFLKLIDEELERLLPKDRRKRIILRGASHRMWFEQPEACRKAVLDFWSRSAGRSGK